MSAPMARMLQEQEPIAQVAGEVPRAASRVLKHLQHALSVCWLFTDELGHVWEVLKVGVSLPKSSLEHE